MSSEGNNSVGGTSDDLAVSQRTSEVNNNSVEDIYNGLAVSQRTSEVNNSIVGSSDEVTITQRTSEVNNSFGDSSEDLAIAQRTNEVTNNSFGDNSSDDQAIEQRTDEVNNNSIGASSDNLTVAHQTCEVNKSVGGSSVDLTISQRTSEVNNYNSFGGRSDDLTVAQQTREVINNSIASSSDDLAVAQQTREVNNSFGGSSDDITVAPQTGEVNNNSIGGSVDNLTVAQQISEVINNSFGGRSDDLTAAQQTSEVINNSIASSSDDLAVAQQISEVNNNSIGGSIDNLTVAHQTSEVNNSFEGSIDDLTVAQQTREVNKSYGGSSDDLAVAQQTNEVNNNSIAGSSDDLAVAQQNSEVNNNSIEGNSDDLTVAQQINKVISNSVGDSSGGLAVAQRTSEANNNSFGDGPEVAWSSQGGSSNGQKIAQRINAVNNFQGCSSDGPKVAQRTSAVNNFQGCSSDGSKVAQRTSAVNNFQEGSSGGLKVAQRTSAANNFQGGSNDGSKVAQRTSSVNNFQGGSSDGSKVAPRTSAVNNFQGDSSDGSKVAQRTSAVNNFQGGSNDGSKVAQRTSTANNFQGGSNDGSKVAQRTSAANNFQGGSNDGSKVAQRTSAANNFQGGSSGGPKVAQRTSAVNNSLGGSSGGPKVARRTSEVNNNSFGGRPPLGDGLTMAQRIRSFEKQGPEDILNQAGAGFGDAGKSPSAMKHSSTSTRDTQSTLNELKHVLHDEIPCEIMYMDTNANMRRFNTFDELSEFLLDSAAIAQSKQEAILDKTVRLPLDNIVHYMSMGKFLKRLYEREELMDITIFVRGIAFRAHRIALCCHSEYFAQAIKAGKNAPTEMHIKGISAEAFAAFLEFIYSGEVKVYPRIATDLLVVAECLKVPDLQSKYDSIVDNIPTSHFVRFAVSKDHNDSLSCLLRDRLLKEFIEVQDADEILDMDVELLCQLFASGGILFLFADQMVDYTPCNLFSNGHLNYIYMAKLRRTISIQDDLVVRTELEVFSTAMRWLFHKPDERLRYVARIMGLVRFMFMTQEEMFSCVETSGVFRSDEKFRNIIVVANWIMTCRQLYREDAFDFLKPNPRHCYKMKFPVSVAHKSIQCDLDEGDLDMSSMPAPLMTSSPVPYGAKYRHAKPVMASPGGRSSGSAAVPLSEISARPYIVDIYVVGGFLLDESEDTLQVTERYDAARNQWLRFCKLPEARTHHAAATWSGYLYVIGGCTETMRGTDTMPTAAVHKMDLDTRHWTGVAGMNEARMSHGVCEVYGNIYAVGGSGSTGDVLASVEWYSPTADCWTTTVPMLTARSAAGVAALDGKIYVAGGFDSNGVVLASVECFSPEDGKWTRLNNLRLPRCNCCLTDVNGRLFLSGGLSYFSPHGPQLVSLASVDEYLTENDSWSYRDDMIIPRHDTGAAVAGDRLYIIGGCSTTAGRVLQSIECYDTRHYCWLNGVPELPHPSRWISCVTVLNKKQP